MKKYNKLVRDNIPQIIVKDGKNFKIRILSDQEYLQALKTKLVEEAEELSKAKTDKDVINELADIYEVLEYIIRRTNVDYREIQSHRVKKNMERGAFDDKIYLEYVE